MKLQRIRQELPPARLRLTLPGELKATLDAYAAYYRDQYGDLVGLEALIPQMLTTFVGNDRDFRQWQHAHAQPDSSSPLSSAPLTPRATESSAPPSAQRLPRTVRTGEQHDDAVH
jgi:hypothetical protein